MGKVQSLFINQLIFYSQNETTQSQTDKEVEKLSKQKGTIEGTIEHNASFQQKCIPISVMQ